MEDALVQSIELSLANCLTNNAIFYAEQLVALSRPRSDDEASEHSLHLLAMSYIQGGKHTLAIEALKGCNSPKNLYLRAIASIALFRYTEAELALQPPQGISSDDDYKDVPNGAYGIYLLGVIKRRLGAPKLAIKYFTKSLELNPLLWCAYENLCQLGASNDPSDYFGSEDTQLLSIQTISQQNPVIEVLQTGKGPAKIVPKPTSQPERSAVSTPAIVKKMRVAMSPADMHLQRDSKEGRSLSRRLFETPRTPADSMLGIASSTPSWAPTRRSHGVSAVVFPVQTPTANTLGTQTIPASSRTTEMSSSRSTGEPSLRAQESASARSASNEATSTSRATETPSATPTRGIPQTSAVTSKQVAGASPKSKASAPTAPTAKSSSSASRHNAPVPTPRRTVTTATTSTPAASAKTGRVMPARAAKSKSEKSLASAHMTPIPSSLPTATSSTATIGTTPTTTTPPATATTKNVDVKQPPPPRARQVHTRQVSKRATAVASAPDDEDDEPVRPIPAFVISSRTPNPASEPLSSDVKEPVEHDAPKLGGSSKQQGEIAAPSFKMDTSALASSSASTSVPEPQSPTNSLASAIGLSETSQSSTSQGQTQNVSSLSSSGDRKEEQDDEDLWNKSMTLLLSFLRQLGMATRLMELYKCKEAIDAFTQLTASAQGSPYVLSSIGRCYYELSDQERARQTFVRLRKRWPSVVLNMAVYSNILWHLREKMELSALAHDMMKLDPRSVEAWCAMGNSFSLEGDVDNALNAFQRASQVSPEYCYTYTLAGHEYLAKEDLTKALESFRLAVTLDPRHYRAWYGLGLVAYQQQKLTPARMNFLKALEIFPGAAILHTSLGLCAAASEAIPLAITHFQKAVELNPTSPHAKYHLLSMYVSAIYMKLPQGNLRTTKTGLEDGLHQLLRLLPRCGALHLLSGRIYKVLGKKDESEEEFSIAKELDPKTAEFVEDVIVVYDPPEIA